VSESRGESVATARHGVEHAGSRSRGGAAFQVFGKGGSRMRIVPSRLYSSRVSLAAALAIALVAVTASPAATVAAPQDARRPMTVDDALRMARIGDVLVSPDGAQVFYSVAQLDWEKNRRLRRYYLADFEDGSAREYVGEQGGSSFRFSPDGSTLTFLREVEEEDQLFSLANGGGEAVQLSRHAGGIEDYKWAPDSSAVFFTAEETRSKEDQAEHALGDDAVFVDEGPNGKNEARYVNLWVLDIEDREETKLTDESFLVGSFDVNRDGDRVVLAARPDDRTNYPFMSELYLLERASGDLRRLTDNRAPENAPLWAPDGDSFLYHAPSDVDFDLRSGYFWIMDVTTDTARRLEGQNTGEIDGVAWTADGAGILFNENRGAATNLYRLDVSSDEVTAVTDRPGTMRARAYSADRRRIVFSYEDHTTPADLWAVADGGDPVRLTDVNPSIGDTIAVTDGELVGWSGKGGMRIEGVFMNSLGHQPGTQQPLVVHIHGGPAGVITNSFDAEFQVLAGLGYSILAPNVRGSSGYGDEVLRGLMGEVGDGEFIDMMAGVDFVIENRDIDPERLGVRGWSWGGVATSFTITQTDRFKAASVGAMVGNWAAETGPGFNFDVSLWYIGGTPWDNPEEWAQRSSITHVRNVTTPTIIFHGARDETSSVGQSLMFFTALRDIGKAPVRYIKFPRQRHGIEEPRLERVHLIEEIRWFKKYIDGIEWEPWEVPQ